MHVASITTTYKANTSLHFLHAALDLDLLLATACVPARDKYRTKLQFPLLSLARMLPCMKREGDTRDTAGTFRLPRHSLLSDRMVVV